MIKVVFGWYSFKIKSFTAKDLDLDDEVLGASTIEVRQKCFHLFWIPFFGIGKKYVLRKEDGLYELPEQFVDLVKSKGRIRTPFYTFSVFLLVLLAAAYMTLEEQWRNYGYYSYAYEQHEIETANNLEMVKNLDTTLYIKLTDSKYQDVSGFFAKIEKIEKDRILVLMMNTGLAYTSESNSGLIREHYLKYRTQMDSNWVNIADLGKAICRDYDSLTMKIAFGLDFFGTGKKYIIESMERIDDGPIIKSDGCGSMGGGGISISFNNYGAECTLIKIENVIGSIQWTNTLPKTLEHDGGYSYAGSGGFSLNGEGYNWGTEYSFILHLKDEQNRMFEYQVTGYDMSNSSERL
ncbi:MAG: hypothetical protein QNK23_07245 [Crocinitomicaceae bacterium]|nr:hypothetical protein [Crocinitomicaceae bacterium]